MELESITRVPRPLGLTLLSLNYQKSQSEEDLESLQKHIVSQYALQGFRYNNQPMSINEFSHYTSIPESITIKLISKVSEKVGAFNSPEQVQDTLTSLASLSMNWAIQDRGLVMHHLGIMMQAQGNSYKPFISGEVSKALKLGLDSNRNIMEIYKSFFSSQTNILNIYNNNISNSNTYITPESAFDLVQNALNERNQERRSLSQSNQGQLPEGKKNFDALKVLQEDELDMLFQEHGLASSPDCLEKRTGTEALQRIGIEGVTEPQGSEATPLLGPNEGHEVLQPEGLWAPKRAKKPNSHEAFEDRRGEEFIDYDEVD